MLSKKCTKCEVEKAVSEFGKDKGTQDGLKSWCKKCNSREKKLYRRTKAGLVAEIYDSQKLNSKRRGHPMPTYTRQELKEWLYSQTLFHVLFDNWKKSGYESDLRPSCDRTDDYQGYCLSRLQLLTWKENKAKGNRDRKNGVNNKMSKAVKQYDLGGNLIREYYSISQAERDTGISHGHISSCCSGRYKTVGGYVWEYSEN